MSYERYRQPTGPTWLHTFTAVFAGALLAGVVLLLGIRLYIQWSVADAMKAKDTPAKVK